MAELPNIVQAEFFLVDGDPDMTFESFMAQMQERIMDGFSDLRAGMDPADVRIGVKICMRFYDYTGAITQAVAREQRAQEDLNNTLKELGGQQSLIRRYLLYRRLKRLSKEAPPGKRRSHALSIKALAAVLRKHSPAAIETWDHRFRTLRREEAHEVMESIMRSKISWIFCFEHNDLLAGTNVGIAHAM
jgi:hypothetical protein